MRVKAMETAQEARVANAAARGSAAVLATTAAAATAAAAAAAAAAACRLCEEGESPRGDAQAGRRDAVRRAMQHAWRGYEAFAWGLDELDTSSQTGEASYRMALTMVDSLDTLFILGLEDEFRRAASWLGEHLRFGEQEGINLFEVTIRVLGGLLSAFELSHDAQLLQRADELASQLLFAFNSPSGLPYGTVGLRTRTATNPAWAKGASTVAEVASLQLEFRALSRHTGNPAYEAVAQRVMAHLRDMPRPTSLPAGLYPTLISPVTGEFVNADVTLGARADSLYEYLLKQWLLSSRTDGRVRRMYEQSVAAIGEHLVASGGPSRCRNCTLLRQWNHRTRTYNENMDHLVCFVPGMLALGAQGDTAAADLRLAERLMETCYRMYADQVQPEPEPEPRARARARALTR